MMACRLLFVCGSAAHEAAIPVIPQLSYIRDFRNEDEKDPGENRIHHESKLHPSIPKAANPASRSDMKLQIYKKIISDALFLSFYSNYFLTIIMPVFFT